MMSEKRFVREKKVHFFRSYKELLHVHRSVFSEIHSSVLSTVTIQA